MANRKHAPLRPKQMSERRQIVRRYQPHRMERFDDQFWPIFMAMTITATILAATIATLMAGFWMWASLMVLPAAITTLLFVLRFVDNRRLRRSMQLAMILSLAVHCIFVITAHQTNIFKGQFLQVNRKTSPTKQRVINISRQANTQPWVMEQPTEAPTPYEPVEEKTAEIDTSTSKPQPSQIESQTPSENPQLVRRRQLNKTVPRLGKQLSQLSRQSKNTQPKSTEKIAVAQPAPRQSKNSQPAASMQAAASSELESRSQSSPASAADRPTQSASSSASQPSESRPVERMARTDSRQPSPSSSSRPTRSSRSTTQPTESPAAPTAVASRRPKRSSRSSADRSTSRPVAAANLTRRTPSSVSPNRAKLRNQKAASSPTDQMAMRNPRTETPRSTVAKTTPSTRISRSESNQPAPASPDRIERPRPVNRTAASSGATTMQPKPMATERSSNGSAGVGRTSNMNRDVGSRQSPATVASDSMRRREQTSQQPDANSLTQRQMARVPRTTASQLEPSSTFRADSIPTATRTASATPTKMTASSSAALTQANSSAQRAESSAEKGTGSVDMGPTRIVTNDLERGVEGGGQPEIEYQQTTESSTRGESGGATPSLVADQIQPTTMNSGSSSRTESVSNEPTPAATADMIARSDGGQYESGEPVRSQEAGESFANTNEVDMAEATMGRSENSSDSLTDEDEEERRRQAALAQQRMNRQARNSGDDDPAIGGSRGSAPQIASNGRTGSTSSTANASRQAMSDAAAGAGSRRRTSTDAESSGATRSASSSRAASRPTDLAGQGDRSRNRQASSDRPEVNDNLGTSNSRSLARSNSTGQANVGTAEAPTMAGQVTGGQGQANQKTQSDVVAAVDRATPSGIELDIDARSGPAGVGNQPTPDPGIDSRQASRSSPAIQSMTETRFRSDRAGGTPSVSSAPVIAREAFRSRKNPSRTSTGPRTEEAIELGLAFLARNQQEDGSWTLSGYDTPRKNMKNMLASDTAATGLAILAFQGAGYSHKEFKYSRQLQAAIDWMIEQQQETGELYITADDDSNAACRLYSHGIATLALCEAYGMTQDEKLRQPVQIALDFIADSQHNQGGWRYIPRKSSDTSVSGWMMMALQSGRLAGLQTEEETWEGIENWLTLAVDAEKPHLFRYDPFAADTFDKRHGRQPSPCMTAVGLLMNLYLGWDRSDYRLNEGARYLLQHLPDDSTIIKRDTYYWYYATQIMRHVGGEPWEQWHAKLHPLLVNSQIKDGEMAGSWHPLDPVPDRWGAQAGRLYVTTMNLLSLEVDYRLLPLHDDTAK